MFKIFISWHLGLFLLGIWGSIVFQKIPGGGINPLSQNKGFSYIETLLQWDGGYYLSIAKFGYQNSSDFAFFPLYPLLIKTLSNLVGNHIFWGLVISNISFLTFLLFIFHTISKKYSKKIGFNVFITYLLFPTAFFTTAYYSESLFLLLAFTAIYAIENKKHFLAAIFISLSSLTRMLGAFLIVSFFYKYFTSNSGRVLVDRKIIYPLLSACGIVLYTFYLFTISGNPLQFSSVQALWGREVVDPISIILSYIWTFLYEFKNPIDYLDFLLTISFLVILVIGIRKISPSLWIFSILTILIPAASGTLTSMPRYLLTSIGAFIIIGIYLEEKPFLQKPFWVISLILQIILYVRFLNGYWVA